MMAGRNRIVELDALKAMAIVMIVIAHTFSVVPLFSVMPQMLSLGVGISTIGLAIFFFTSGYSLMLRKPTFQKPNDFWIFLRKRIVRIYPLYWVALIVATIVISAGQPIRFHLSMTDFTLLQQLLIISGLQVLFYPNTVAWLGMLWFVSVIMLFYLLFPILIGLAQRAHMGFTKSLFLVASMLFVTLVIVFLTTGAIGLEHVYIYYWIFIAGIMLGNGTSLASIKSTTLVKYCFIMGAGLAFFYEISVGPLGNIIKIIPPSLSMMVALALIGAIGVSISILLVNFVGGHFTGRIQTAVEKVGSSTYPIYLFHIYFLTLFVAIGGGLGPLATAILVACIGIPSALIFPIYTQDIIDRTIAFAKVRISKNLAKGTEL